MNRRRIGGPFGPEVSALCLGTMYFGTKVGEGTAFEILDRFVERGGTFLDSANSYAFWVDRGVGGESESLIGRWLTSRGLRDYVEIGTKVGALPTAPGLDDTEGLSSKVIQRQARESLRRLGTDRIDVYYAHWEDRTVDLEETVAAFAELKASGTIRTTGVSNHPIWRVERARAIARMQGIPGYTCVQQLHTYFHVRPGADTSPEHLIDSEWLDYCRGDPDLTLLAYSPLLKGGYVRPERLPSYFVHPGTTARLETLRRVADDVGATPNQVVLAWLLEGEPPSIPVLGVSSVEQLDECLGAVDMHLDDQVRHVLDNA